mgnify:CR=1 FL=1
MTSKIPSQNVLKAMFTIALLLGAAQSALANEGSHSQMVEMDNFPDISPAVDPTDAYWKSINANWRNYARCEKSYLEATTLVEFEPDLSLRYISDALVVGQSASRRTSTTGGVNDPNFCIEVGVERDYLEFIFQVKLKHTGSPRFFMGNTYTAGLEYLRIVKFRLMTASQSSSNFPSLQPEASNASGSMPYVCEAKCDGVGLALRILGFSESRNGREMSAGGLSMDAAFTNLKSTCATYGRTFLHEDGTPASFALNLSLLFCVL